MTTELQKVDPKECHICGKQDAELFTCEKCDELYCENCGAVYDQFTQIDYDCCKMCADSLYLSDY